MLTYGLFALYRMIIDSYKMKLKIYLVSTRR